MKQRHPNVVNEAEVQGIPLPFEPKFKGEIKRLGAASGARALGCSLTEVPPGYCAFPKHAHLGNEEAIFVLSGSGELEIGADKVAVEPGDYITLLADKHKGHSLRNTGSESLRYLCVSTMKSPEVVVYPHSKKVGVLEMKGEERWVKMFREESDVDYLDGE